MKKSIRAKILIPVLVLGIISILSNFLSFINLTKVNNKSEVIASDYITSILELSEIQTLTMDIHAYSLSHIIATDFDSMIGYTNAITEDEAKVEELFETYHDQDNPNFQNMVSDYENMKISIRQLLAYSANQNSVEAYSIANGEVLDYANSIEASINAMNDEISDGVVSARKSLFTVSAVARVCSMAVIAISIFMVIFAVMIVSRMVVTPIRRAESEITSIISDIEDGNGDLTKRITISSEDEIAALGNGINNFMEKLQNILFTITGNSEKMEIVVNDVLGSVRTSNDSASDLSALTEELAATMQEVSNRANTINDNAEQVSNEVNVFAEKSTELNAYSKTMKAHADSMEQAARSNMDETKSKVSEILEVLSQAIEDSKSVDQVNSLTNDILTISSQTNLLALNASIEAARAGEAGKGFAVVADEISALADSSRQAAGNIQEINGVVTAAVHNLSDQANGLVEFMQESILPEFAKFVEEGGKYKENASFVESTMNEFTSQTDYLKEVIDEIAASINAISSAIEEGVTGVTGAAESTQTLVEDMDNITRRMDENQKIASDLMSETSIFTKLE